ncbi:NAD(P)/FAD-dependent oxidoreductase [Halopseudomonas pelagia]|uniref:NAD(P)/FAD-dependent oxidoreductase n=1 Tax=Halopseudomonas pelagia TaxID=553151 RepID=UPI0003A0DCA5|nr:FAD-dependent oxidoreductase [Halopseudomonas pelagia]|tara:strand:+ start:598 stop:1587 length:990 start_codon:yes stop_codon:yes gene_type:complete
MTHTHSIAIIGAGLAGISAGTALAAEGQLVTLFDKSRGSGGRMSSKRTEFGDLDMGAQYFTARDSHFRHELRDWLDKGWVSEWDPAMYSYDDQGLHSSSDDLQRFVGNPRMTGLSRELLAGLNLVSQTHISRLRQDDQSGWLLIDDQDQVHGPFERVIVATPAPQAIPLLEQAPQLAHTVSQVQMDPGWTLAVAFHTPLNTPVEACFVRAGPLDWISRNSSKPGRSTQDSWVLQSTPEWALAHLETDKSEVSRLMLAAFNQIIGGPIPEPAFLHVHRWLYARPTEPCQWGALAAPEKGLYVCGDWCLGGRIENAWLSGQQAARTLMDKR